VAKQVAWQDTRWSAPQTAANTASRGIIAQAVMMLRQRQEGFGYMQLLRFSD